MVYRLAKKIPRAARRCEFPSATTQLLKALANRNRLTIILILSREECTVGDLSQKARISMSNCSQHLTVLKRQGIVRARYSYNGRSSFYSLAPERKALVFEILRMAIQRNVSYV
jgi:DNA-binding transcriptional ArsR family regulator